MGTSVERPLAVAFGGHSSLAQIGDVSDELNVWHLSKRSERRRVGGGLGPTEFSDGSLTTTPTGYPEEMHGHGKKISPIDNNAAHL